ncbi:hypothetical protein [Methylophilus sp. Leaf414]|jgi:hypothetical protein|uniref:hypothetical protein n=1 Tax=Methylophilus sp. Leaf414 TaxID=1736371 RepID=UPI0006F6F17B|nr:hypothetical protein [Methylophilus sp. Leaf414]KQT36274.1 hypothetical protein ASG24_08435 [Methylophilus sp. Leaf414]
MKNTLLNAVVVSSLATAPLLALALGFESVPATGFSVTGTGAGTHQPTGGTTPYKICNGTGNYGSLSTGAVAPTTTSNNTCAIVPAPSSILISPVSGFSLVASANRPVNMNNTLTGGTSIQIGTLQDVVFRNAAGTECIYGAQVSLTNTDYNVSAPGTQTFEANGIARAGFSSAGNVSVAYARILAGSDVVYRAGRTFTSVQHRAVSLGSGTFAPGYYNLPLTPGSTASINGQNVSALGVPAAAEQTANLDTNWLEFTTDANSVDDDGSTSPASPAVYVRAACTTAAPVATANAIRLRSTWQEQGTGQQFIEVRVDGFLPSGTNANPAPVAGSTF